MANIYRVYNGVGNDVYKYDFKLVVNCNSYNVFSCVWVNGHVCIKGCDILPDGKLIFAEQEGKRLLMLSNNGNYEKDIVTYFTKDFNSDEKSSFSSKRS
jgi:hypothetical protein